MEKVNIMFHENGTMTFQHRKILEFAPDLSVGDPKMKLVVPNIPLLVSCGGGGTKVTCHSTPRAEQSMLERIARDAADWIVYRGD